MCSFRSARGLDTRRRARTRGARPPPGPSVSVPWFPRRPPPPRVLSRWARVRNAGRARPRGGVGASDRRARGVAQATRRGLWRPRAVRAHPRDGRRGCGDEGPEAGGCHLFAPAVRRRDRGGESVGRSFVATSRPAGDHHIRGDGPERPAGTARQGVSGGGAGRARRRRRTSRADAPIGRRAGERPRVPSARLRHDSARAGASVHEREGDTIDKENAVAKRRDARRPGKETREKRRSDRRRRGGDSREKRKRVARRVRTEKRRFAALVGVRRFAPARDGRAAGVVGRGPRAFEGIEARPARAGTTRAGGRDTRRDIPRVTRRRSSRLGVARRRRRGERRKRKRKRRRDRRPM